MGLLGQMTVMFGADTGGLTRGISTAQNALRSLADNPTAAVGQGLLVAGAAAVGFAVQSVDAASAFQQSMLKVQAYAGLTKQQTDNMSNSIMQMSTQLGQSPKAMADAIYPIISSGYSASQALNILSLSAKTAAASGANMSVVADMLTTSLKASGAPASQAGHYMDMFNKIVSLGKGEVPAYAAVIGKLTLAAGSAHVPFDQMGAALATLTTHGFPSVAQASNALGNLFTQIGPKVDALATHAAKLGLSFDENKFKTMDLSDKLAYLQKITGGNQGELLKLVGGSTLALKAFSALSGSSADFASNMKQMQNATGATDAAFATASGGFNASMARMSAAMDVLKIKVGSALLPALTQLTNAVTPLIGSFATIVTSASPVTRMFTGMTNNWLDFADSVNTGPIVSAFNGLKASAQGLSTPFALLGVMLNNVNNFLIDVAGYASGLVAPGLRMLSQVVSGVGGVLQTIALSVSSSLLPALHNLVAAVAPIITAFVQWVAQSNIIPIAFGVLRVAVGLVIQGISLLINIIAGLITFFSQNALGIAIFRAALILLGVALTAIAIVVIPSIIAGLIGMASAAITTGISMAIAFAPIVLPILAIIAVIALVVLAVTHWGQIAGWIQGVWSTALNAIGAWFASTWQAIQSKTTQFLSFLGGAVQSGMKAVFDFFMAPINLMGQAFVWLYNHNTYIKLMVDTVIQDVTRLSSWLSGAVTTVKNTVVNAFLYVYTGAVMYWTLVNTAIQTRMNAASNYLSGIWRTIVATVSSAAQGVWQKIVSMWQLISSVFASAYGTYIGGPLSSIWGSVSSTIEGWINQAEQFGANFMHMLAQGITNGIGEVGAAASNAASQIGKFLGFHSPTELGVGASAHLWMPNLINMMKVGLLNGAPVIASAANTVAGSLTPLTGTGTGTTTSHISATKSASSSAKHSSGSTHTITYTAPSTHTHTAPGTHHHIAASTHHHLASGVHHHTATGKHTHTASGIHHHLGSATHHHTGAATHQHKATSTVHHHLAVGTHHHLASGVHHHLASGVHHHLAATTHHHLAPSVSTYSAPSVNTYSGTNNNTFTGTNNNKFPTSSGANNQSGGKQNMTLILEIDSREFARATAPAMGEELTRRIRLNGRAA